MNAGEAVREGVNELRKAGAEIDERQLQKSLKRTAVATAWFAAAWAISTFGIAPDEEGTA